MTEEIYLPKDTKDAAIQIVIFRCAQFIGKELGNFYNEKMKNLQGDGWLKELSIIRREYNLNLYDPVWALKEPLNSDSPLRQFLPKSSTFYNKMNTLKKLRNGAVHNEINGDLLQTIESVQVFFDVAFEIGLSECANQFASLIKRLREIETGKVFADTDSEKLALAESEKLQLEDKVAEMNEKINQSISTMDKLEKALIDKEAEYQSMLSSMGNTSDELAKAKVLLEQKEEILENLKVQKSYEGENIKEIIDEKNRLQEIASLLAEIVMDDSRLDEFRSRYEEDVPEDESLIQNSEQIGDVWHDSKGRKKIVLSVKSRDLLDSRTNEPLLEIDTSTRKKVAEKWLRIRPSGGRVFIDESGNATTLIDDTLIYLGNLSRLFS